MVAANNISVKHSDLRHADCVTERDTESSGPCLAPARAQSSLRRVPSAVSHIDAVANRNQTLAAKGPFSPRFRHFMVALPRIGH